MALGEKRLGLVQRIASVLSELGQKVTVRQLYYQLVVRGIIANTLQSYKSYNSTLTRAREEGYIDPYRFVDRSKPVIKCNSWGGLDTFLADVRESYRRDVWGKQPEYVEVWLEKDALRGIFDSIVYKYDVHLVIGRGYQSYTNLLEAANRINDHTNGEKVGHVLYFGDFDPSGIDIPRNIKARLCEFGVEQFDIEIVSVTPGQIEEHELPPMPVKQTDRRAGRFMAQYGDRAVELDALNPAILEELIEGSIIKYLDKELFDQTIDREKEERDRLTAMIERWEE